jgi:hypothetical protein
MDTWRREVDLGLLALKRHRPRVALSHLDQALRGCPEARGAELARMLFYLGVTLRRLGLANPAVRSWIACQKVAKRGYGGKMLDRYANEYGMDRQGSSDEDDRLAFAAVHMGRYLRSRSGRQFQSQTEKRLVGALIHSHWEELLREHDLSRMTASAKCELFRSVTIELPAFVGVHDDRRIVVDFACGRRVFEEDRCSCGSGRPFGACCGRIQGTDGLVTGSF